MNDVKQLFSVVAQNTLRRAKNVLYASYDGALRSVHEVVDEEKKKFGLNEIQRGRRRFP